MHLHHECKIVQINTELFCVFAFPAVLPTRKLYYISDPPIRESYRNTIFEPSMERAWSNCAFISVKYLRRGLSKN